MIEAIDAVLRADPRILYALVFGSHARGTAHANSDLDIAIATSEPLATRDLLDLLSRLESATRQTVDLVLLDEAPPALAYRIFKDGIPLCERDHSALVKRKAKAILDYLDFKPIEDILTRGALAAARRG